MESEAANALDNGVSMVGASPRREETAGQAPKLFTSISKGGQAWR